MSRLSLFSVFYGYIFMNNENSHTCLDPVKDITPVNSLTDRIISSTSAQASTPTSWGLKFTCVW